MPLHQIVPEAEKEKEDDYYKVDIIAVHGLNPKGKPNEAHAFGTWSRSVGEGERPHLWLRDDLPKSCPKARVFIYEYNSNLLFRQTAEPFIDKANDFLELLRIRRRKDPSRPLIMIGHSLGGILIEQALVNAHNNADYIAIRDATCALIFFGTPHGGGNKTLVSLGAKAAALAIGLGFREKSDIVTTLQQGSIFSNILKESFRHQLDSYEIVSFWEEIGNIVPRDSAIFGLPGKRERIVPINANHSNICRFDTSQPCDKANLELVMGSVEEKYDMAVERSDLREPAIDSAEVKRIRKWLYTIDQTQHPNDFEADLARHTPLANTCKWIEARPEFTGWLNESKSGVLWINGIPGSGKTVLTASVISNLQSMSANVMYYFCDDIYSETRWTAKVLGCLVSQMIELDRRVLKCVTPVYNKSNQEQLTSIEVVKRLFKESLKMVAPCYLIIDALDECADREKLIPLILEIATSVPEGLKILVTSRDYLDIRRQLERRTTNHPLVELSIREHNTSDIEVFITHLVEESGDLAPKLEASPLLSQYVVEKLRSAASGMFLLPQYMVEDLEKESEIHDIYNCLKNLPTSLDEYYMLILQRMDTRRQKLARKVFTWTTGSKRPLSMKELSLALSLDGSTYVLLESEIKRACGCLLKIDNQQVRLSHSTVKQFLLESTMLRSSPLRSCFVDENAPGYISDICSRYIFSQDFPRPLLPEPRFSAATKEMDKDRIRENYPFLEYTALYWIEHCRLSRSSGEFITSVRSFLESSQLLTWYEAFSIFNTHESFAIAFDQLRVWFQSLNVVSYGGTLQCAQDMVRIKEKISHLWDFIDTWDSGLRGCPSEIHNLGPLIDNPHWCGKDLQQQILFTGNLSKKEDQRLYNLLDGQKVGFACDRFLVAAKSIFTWHSLMRSGVWPATGSPQLDPLVPQQAWFCAQHLQSRCVESRSGLAQAAADKVTVTAVLSKNLDAMAIVWPVYDSNKDAPPVIKSYAWIIRRNSICVLLKRIEWTDFEDPCRVDQTRSRAFNDSRAAIAFTSDGKTLWTPGGAYTLQSGHQTPPPNIFCDPAIRALTFSRNATVVGGIRNGSIVEVHRIADDRLIGHTVPMKNPQILGMSPSGEHCLFLRESDSLIQSTAEEICLFSIKGCRTQTLWEREGKIESGDDPRVEIEISLRHFYNNGGLFSFSENEHILVLYIPSRPDWRLVGFDLTSMDVAKTIWNIDCSRILMDSSLICISFCPFNERQLYMLDDSGCIRACQISRKETVASRPILTTIVEKAGAICTGILINEEGAQLIVAKLPQDDLAVHPFKIRSVGSTRWNLSRMIKNTELSAQIYLLRTLASLQVHSLWIDPDAFIYWGALSQAWRLQVFPQLRLIETIQERIDVCIDVTKDNLLVTYNEETKQDDKSEAGVETNGQGNGEGHSTTNEKNKEAMDKSTGTADEPFTHTTPSSEEKTQSQGDTTSISENSIAKTQMQSRSSSRILLSSNANLLFCTTMILVSRSSFSSKNMADVSIITSIVDTETLGRRYTASLNFLEIGTHALEEDLTIAYDPERGVLAYGISLQYSRKLGKVNNWRAGYLFLCNLNSQSLVIDDISGRISPRKVGIYLEYGFDNMIFSECGRYIYGTSSRFSTKIIEVDTWKAALDPENASRLISFPDGMFAPAECLTLSLWKSRLMLVGTRGDFVVAVQITPGHKPKAEFSRAILAIAPSLAKTATHLQVLWPDENKDGAIVIISQNGNQIRKDGMIGGSRSRPFVLKVKEQDIGTWETFVEPEVENLLEKDE